jgi:Zn-dependent peptidase ImmA (M78 family)/DNA-binding XRE family transcriptional regulator
VSERVEAIVDPRLLVWARASSGFDADTAAKKVGVKGERLQEWESGTARPTIKQLRRLAHVYKRPIAVFYLPEPPADFPIPKDYRRLVDRLSEGESPNLRYEVRQAVSRREIALELLAEEGERPLSFDEEAEPFVDPAFLGERIRTFLGVSLDLQESWRNPYESFGGWRLAIERAGALVLQMTSVEMDEARAFSIGEWPLPVVVVNIKDSPRGRIFSLLHEVAHLVIRRSGLCDLDDTSERDPADLRLESYCNAVAGAALVPGSDLLSLDDVRNHTASPTWSDDELASLSRRFGVSREVVLRRLLDLGETTPSFYREKRDQFRQEYEDIRRNRRPGFAPPHQIALASAGPSFTGLVLSSYASGTITASDVSDFLGIHLKHLGRVESQLARQSRPA